MVKIATTFMTAMVQTSACWGGAVIHISQYVRCMLFASPEQLHIHIYSVYQVLKKHTHTPNIISWPKHQWVQSMQPKAFTCILWKDGMDDHGLELAKRNQKQFWMDDCDCRSRTDGLKMKLRLVVHIQDCLVLPQMHLAWIV